MVSTHSNAKRILARRLRQLRQEQWPEIRVTQRELAKALGVSEPSVSSWENPSSPAVPSRNRIAGYAVFFASTRSMGRSLLRAGELTEEETANRRALLQELTRLHSDATGDREADRSTSTGALGGTWRFPDDAPLRIVSSELSDKDRSRVTPAHPTGEYGEFYAFGNIDALFELHGHIRAANPRSDVGVVKVADMRRDDYSAHLAVVGGVDWNRLTRRLQGDSRLNIPVRQVSTGDDPATACFEIAGLPDAKRYTAAVTTTASDDRELLSDVGYIYRAPNPFNRLRTLTVCNGHFSLGTYGVVRSLTDVRFRGRNEGYLKQRFAGQDSYCVLMRIDVLNGDEATTPDLAEPTTRLYEWPEASS